MPETTTLDQHAAVGCFVRLIFWFSFGILAVVFLVSIAANWREGPGTCFGAHGPIGHMAVRIDQGGSVLVGQFFRQRRAGGTWQSYQYKLAESSTVDTVEGRYQDVNSGEVQIIRVLGFGLYMSDDGGTAKDVTVTIRHQVIWSLMFIVVFTIAVRKRQELKRMIVGDVDKEQQRQ